MLRCGGIPVNIDSIIVNSERGERFQWWSSFTDLWFLKILFVQKGEFQWEGVISRDHMETDDDQNEDADNWE